MKKILLAIGILVLIAWIFAIKVFAEPIDDLNKVNKDIMSLQNQIAQAQQALGNAQVRLQRLQGVKMYLEEVKRENAQNEAIKASKGVTDEKEAKSAPKGDSAPNKG
jgi:cell division protein FtsL